MHRSALEVRGLGRRFGALKAVDDLSLDVAGGEIVGLIGPNGAGKTTAIHLISGVLKADQGSVHLDGVDVTRRTTHALAGTGLRRTFQSTSVYRAFPVRENIYRGGAGHLSGRLWDVLVGSRRHREARAAVEARVDAVMAEFDLGQFGDRPAGDLPYGWQKIVGLCMALVAEPRIVLLDEPAAGLSAYEAGMVGEAIVRLRDRGMGLLVVDHNMQFIGRICRRIVVMHHGTVLASGDSATVMKDGRVIEAYLGAPAA